jgi:carboxyl-terminal processing protease
VYSLNIDKFKVAQAEIEEKAKKYKPLVNYKSTLSFSSLPNEMEAMSKDASLKKKETAGEALSKDIYMEEAINVLDDLQPRSMSAKDTS